LAKVTLSQTAFEYLVKHLVEIEEEKNKFCEQYFMGLSQERREFEKLIKDYIEQVQQFIGNAKKSQTADNSIPLVVIGSKLEVQDLDDREVFECRIISPLNGSVNERDISCLSPVGRSLLLKKVGDEIEVNAPGGLFRYKVISVQL